MQNVFQFRLLSSSTIASVRIGVAPDDKNHTRCDQGNVFNCRITNVCHHCEFHLFREIKTLSDYNKLDLLLLHREKLFPRFF